MLADLSRMSATKFILKYNIALGTVRKKRRELNIKSPNPSAAVWTPAMLARLGTAPDGALAKEWGLTDATVRWQRRRRGIAAYGNRPKYLWTDETLKLLGTMSDRKVAEKLGITWIRVILTRKKHGIPAWGSRPEAQRK
jgi:hypothetical protein